jgi:hypothetical protein
MAHQPGHAACVPQGGILIPVDIKIETRFLIGTWKPTPFRGNVCLDNVKGRYYPDNTCLTH